TSVGGVPANELLVAGGNTFTEGTGTTSNNPVVLNGDSDTLDFTGSGASSFLLHGADTLSGSAIAAGQTVALQVDGDAVLTLSGSMTNGGTIDMIGGCCGNGTAIPGTYAVGDQIVVPSGSTLTNNGTIET